MERRTCLILVLSGLLAAALASGSRAGRSASAGPSSVGTPLGGIGAGKIELLPDGSFGNLTLNNNPEQPIVEAPGSFFALRAGTGRGVAARVLAKNSPYELPTVAALEYDGLFPRADLRFSDPELPIRVSLRAASALVPHNVRSSSLPAAWFSFTLTNPGRAPVPVTLAFSWENVLGAGGSGRDRWDDRTGNAQVLRSVEGRTGILFTTSTGRAGARRNATGEHALLVEAERARVSALTTWDAAGDGDDFWNAFTAASPFVGRAGTAPAPGRPAAALAATVDVPAGGQREVHFALAWHMPHRFTSEGVDEGTAAAAAFPGAWQTAAHVLQYRETLLSGTLAWHDLLTRSSLPAWLGRQVIRDTALMVTNSVLTREGRFALVECPTEEEGSLGTADLWPICRRPLTAFFPTLAASEIDGWAALVREDGGPRRRMGTLSGGFAPPVSEAEPGNPDAACAAILEIYRRYRESGDLPEARSVFPRVVRLLEWLARRDGDGDTLPEGGSAWDRKVRPGTFSYTATLYLAALRAGEAMARAVGDRKAEELYRERHREAADSTLSQLWNGRYLARGFHPDTARREPQLFAGALAGEWAAHGLGLAPRLDPEIVQTALDTLLELLPEGGKGAIPNEVLVGPSPGAVPDRTGRTGPLLAYLAALGIAAGHPDAGLSAAERILAAATAGGKSPAAESYDSHGGTQVGPAHHLSAAGSWNVYAALLGAEIDEPGGRLAVRPSLPAGWNGLHVPFFTPRYWAWADFARGTGSAATNLRLKLVKKLDDRAILLNGLGTVLPKGARLDDLTILLTGPAGTIEHRAARDGDRLDLTFKAPIEWAPGDVIELTLVPPQSNNLVLAFSPSKVISYGSEVEARDLDRGEQIRFTLVNPTRARQVVHVRFRNPSDRNFEVYQNGALVTRFTPDTRDERLALVVPASPIGPDRIEALRAALGKIEELRRRSGSDSRAAEQAAALMPLRRQLEQALEADGIARSAQIVMHPHRKAGILRNRLRQPPPVVAAKDPEPAVAAAEKALAAQRDLLP